MENVIIVTGLAVKSLEEFREIAGLEAKKVSSDLYVVGNRYLKKSCKIVKLSKAVRIGGVLVEYVLVFADLEIYREAATPEEKEAAEQNLMRNTVITGIYAINAEAGILITVGEIFINSEETQTMLRQNALERIEQKGLWQLPQGQTYIKRGP